MIKILSNNRDGDGVTSDNMKTIKNETKRHSFGTPVTKCVTQISCYFVLPLLIVASTQVGRPLQYMVKVIMVCT